MAFDKELALAHRWCDETDAIALEHFRIGALTEIKDDGTPVTMGDREVERALRVSIERAFPRDAILGEEEGATGSGARRWIIDPIDGTKNYARGVPVFATLIALVVDESPVLGVVSAPGLGLRWYATRGTGAFASGGPIHVSTIESLAESDVITGGIDWAEDLGATERALELFRRARRQRGFGDFWGHMLVAQGSAEVMVEFAPLALWDIAAPKLIVEEAGGRVTSFDGDPSLRPGPVLATNRSVHAEALKVLS